MWTASQNLFLNFKHTCPIPSYSFITDPSAFQRYKIKKFKYSTALQLLILSLKHACTKLSLPPSILWHFLPEVSALPMLLPLGPHTCYIREQLLKAGERTQWEKCLFCKHENLSLIPRTHSVSQAWSFMLIILALEKQRKADPWGLPSLVDEFHAFLTKTKRWCLRNDTQGCPISSTYIMHLACMCASTHTCTQK